MDLSLTLAKNQTLKKENTLWTNSIPSRINAMEFMSVKIQLSPEAVSISLPATNGKVNSSELENTRKTKPMMKWNLYGSMKLNIPPSFLMFCLFNFLFSLSSSDMPLFLAMKYHSFFKRPQWYTFGTTNGSWRSLLHGLSVSGKKPSHSFYKLLFLLPEKMELAK